MNSSVRVLAIIVNYNGGEWLARAVGSLLSQSQPLKIVVVDNRSEDNSFELLRQQFGDRDPRIELIDSGANRGVAYGNNFALRYPEYEYILLFNPDARASEDVVEKLVGIMDRHPKIGALAPAILEYDRMDLIQAYKPRLDFLCFPYDAYEHSSVTKLPACEIEDAGYLCTAVAIFRGEAYREAGGMDESFFLFNDDTDLTWRLRLLGWMVVVSPQVRVEHYGGASAPVGRVDSVYQTSHMRVYLRERNAISMAFKNYALFTLAIYAILNSLTLSLEIMLLFVLRKSALAKTYLRAVRDACQSIPATLEKRRVVQSTRVISECRILKLLYPGFAKVWKLRRDGFPEVR